ncbi:LiaF domain-containing protein [Desulfitobacterium sp. Sab5]|uniref:LiaF transmembrane domain-containing protein n=1 Tax=Desulfitobacterium nosdiversum TaxID=3375356 RepID=UPI003CF77AFC
MRRTADSLSRGFLFIVLGIVFFLNSYGVLPWGFWANVVDLWPLIFILGGIALLFSRRIPFSTVMLVFLIVLVGYSFLPGVDRNRYIGPFNGNSSGGGDFLVPMEEGTKKANLTLNLGGTDLRLNTSGPISDPNKLFYGKYDWKANFASANDPAPQISHTKNGNTVNIQFNSERKMGLGTSKMDLTLNPQVDYGKMQINAGAFNGVMNLSELRVNNLDINCGASQLELDLGDTGGPTQAEINAGASKIKLVVPEQVGVKIKLSGFTSSTNFAGDGLVLNDKEWVSSNYDTAKTKVDMAISVAAGKIDLERQKTKDVTY